MKKLAGIGIPALFLAFNFHRIPNCTSPEALCEASSLAGTAAGVAADPLAMFMMLACLILGVRGESFLCVSIVPVVISILIAIDSYPYWVAIGGLPVPQHWLQLLSVYLVLGSIAFWAGLGVRRLRSRGELH